MDVFLHGSPGLIINENTPTSTKILYSPYNEISLEKDITGKRHHPYDNDGDSVK